MDAIGKISKFRSELMGIATIMILLGHSVFYGQGFVDYGIFQDLFTLGYSGVDIFLFLSGFGLVFSMKKNNLSTFYKHRFKRIMPSVILVVILNIVVSYKNIGLHMLNPLYWFGYYWYIGFILIAYLFFPFLYGVLQRIGDKVLFYSIIISIVMFLPFIYIGQAESTPYTCFVTRIPIFVMGGCVGMGGQRWLFRPSILMIMFLLGILLLVPYYLNNNLGGNEKINTYYVFLLITPPLLKVLCEFLGLSFSRNICSSLRLIGKYSLEIYLVQVTIMAPLMHFFNRHDFNMSSNLFISFSIVLITSIIMKCLEEKI